MDERSYRRAAATAESNRPRDGTLASRPDRIALWAVGLSVIAMLAGVASAQADGSGGVAGGAPPAAGGGGSEPAGGTTGGCAAGAEFGTRTLALGDCGDDVRTLNWILKSRSYADGVPLADDFAAPTDHSVREFERRASLPVNGVVEEQTSSELVRSMPSQRATWYGPGFWGNRTACGSRLERSTVGVAHRTLPCGSKVVIRYRGHFLRTRVIDRGPFANGAKWDLTARAARIVGLEVTDEVRAAKIPRR